MENIVRILIKLCKRNSYFHVLRANNRNDYCLKFGPLGTLLMRNIEKEWWNSMLLDSGDPVYPIINPMLGATSVPLSDCSDLLQLRDRKLPFSIAEVKTVNVNHFSREAIQPIEENLIDFKVCLDNLNQYTSLKTWHFCNLSSSLQSLYKWERRRMRWWRKLLGNPSNVAAKASETESNSNTNGYTIQMEFPWGLKTIEEIRTISSDELESYESNIKGKIAGRNGNNEVYPSIIECFSNLEIATMVYLFDALQLYENGENLRKVLKLNSALVPYKVSIVSSQSEGDISRAKDLASYILQNLSKENILVYQNHDLYQNLSLNEQYTRFDEMGIPFLVILDDRSIENGVVKFRNRNTSLEEEIHVSELNQLLKGYLQMK